MRPHTMSDATREYQRKKRVSEARVFRTRHNQLATQFRSKKEKVFRKMDAEQRMHEVADEKHDFLRSVYLRDLKSKYTSSLESMEKKPNWSSYHRMWGTKEGSTLSCIERNEDSRDMISVYRHDMCHTDDNKTIVRATLLGSYD